MAYDTILERQRAVYLTALGSQYGYLAHPGLQYLYLASLGYAQPTLPERKAAWAKANNFPVTQAGALLGLTGPALWTPADLVARPALALDADRLDKVVKSGTTVTAVSSVYNDYPANTPNLITHDTNATLGNRYSFNAPGTAAQALNFSTAAGGLLNNKGGCTMMFFGHFPNPNPGAFNSAVVNATTTSASSTRCAISTSGATSNTLRSTVRRLDADTANGDDYGTNRGTTPFIYILRLDHSGAVVGPNPSKNARICHAGLDLENITEETGLGVGTFSATNSAYIGFFNSGTVAQSLTNMNYGFITDTVYTDSECERLEGWVAWRANLASILPPTHPYKLAAPTKP